MFHVEGQEDARRAALTRGLEVAEAAGATGDRRRIQVSLAHDACLRGQVAEGFAIVERARALAEASGDGEALLRGRGSTRATSCSRPAGSTRQPRRGCAACEAARESGRHTSFWPHAISNAAEAMLARGRTAEAAELIDPLTDATA